MTKIAINGFGRIGRQAFRRILEKHPQAEVAVINDLTDTKTLSHLLKYDSVYGTYQEKVEAKEDALIIGEKEIKCLAEKDPTKLPWKDIGIDVVLECTGRFTKTEEANKHLQAGAKKVIISAPSKSPGLPHFVLGVNQDKYDSQKDNVVSMGSCTTNCLAPLAKIIHDNLEIEAGLMTTIHSYTNDQRLLDLPHRDLRRGRAAALSMVPTTTGAAIAVTKTIPDLKGKIHGLAVRVPSPVVSLIDFVAKVRKKTTVEEVNNFFKKASLDQLKDILGTEETPLVSVDYRMSPLSAIIDLPSTMVQKDNLVKVLAWYDNEWGYSCRLAEFADFIGAKL